MPWIHGITDVCRAECLRRRSCFLARRGRASLASGQPDLSQCLKHVCDATILSWIDHRRLGENGCCESGKLGGLRSILKVDRAPGVGRQLTFQPCVVGTRRMSW
jgi:hypothetical protein